jgi:hypothetical protein
MSLWLGSLHVCAVGYVYNVDAKRDCIDCISILIPCFILLRVLFLLLIVQLCDRLFPGTQCNPSSSKATAPLNVIAVPRKIPL